MSVASLIPLEGGGMKFLAWIGIALVIVWALLWFGVQMAVAAVHLLLLIGIVLIGWGLVQRRSRPPT